MAHDNKIKLMRKKIEVERLKIAIATVLSNEKHPVKKKNSARVQYDEDNQLALF